MSINIDQIVTADYGNIVQKANPTGLLPTWNKWIDKAQAAKLGFKYNVAGAKALLAANGYKDTNGDGYVENKAGQDGQPQADRPERLVGLDDRHPDHRRQREGRRASRSPRRTRTTTGSSTSATRASSTS